MPTEACIKTTWRLMSLNANRARYRIDVDRLDEIFHLLPIADGHLVSKTQMRYFRIPPTEQGVLVFRRTKSPLRLEFRLWICIHKEEEALAIFEALVNDISTGTLVDIVGVAGTMVGPKAFLLTWYYPSLKYVQRPLDARIRHIIGETREVRGSNETFSGWRFSWQRRGCICPTAYFMTNSLAELQEYRS